MIENILLDTYPLFTSWAGPLAPRRAMLHYLPLILSLLGSFYPFWESLHFRAQLLASPMDLTGWVREIFSLLPPWGFCEAQLWSIASWHTTQQLILRYYWGQRAGRWQSYRSHSYNWGIQPLSVPIQEYKWSRIYDYRNSTSLLAFSGHLLDSSKCCKSGNLTSSPLGTCLNRSITVNNWPPDY